MALVLLNLASAHAERRILEKATPRVELAGADDDAEYGIETTPAGDYRFWYRSAQGGAAVSKVVKPPNKLQVYFEAAVSLTEPGFFSYQYKLKSLPQSEQAAVFLIIAHEGTVSEVYARAPWKFGKVPEPLSVIWYPSDGLSGVEPGHSSPEMGWTASALPTGEKDPAPGARQRADSLPGIVFCHVTGPAPEPWFTEMIPGPIVDALPRHPMDGVVGRTIGPVVVPEAERAQWLANRLGSYLEESLAQGWIERESAERYRGAIDVLRRAVDQGDSKQVDRLVAALTKQADADRRAASLTPEAYALMVYNSRALSLAVRGKSR